MRVSLWSGGSRSRLVRRAVVSHDVLDVLMIGRVQKVPVGTIGLTQLIVSKGIAEMYFLKSGTIGSFLSRFRAVSPSVLNLLMIGRVQKLRFGRLRSTQVIVIKGIMNTSVLKTGSFCSRAARPRPALPRHWPPSSRDLFVDGSLAGLLALE